MNCAMPCAPAWLTDNGLNRLSCQIKRTKKSSGSSFCTAERSSVAQIASTEALEAPLGCEAAPAPTTSADSCRGAEEVFVASDGLAASESTDLDGSSLA